MRRLCWGQVLRSIPPLLMTRLERLFHHIRILVGSLIDASRR